MPARFLKTLPDAFRIYKRKDEPRRQHFVGSMDRSIVNTKGLSNNSGENNCFLNSAVQMFWHLDAFRKNFNMLNNHTCVEKSCIFCALKVIFTQFQFSEEKVLPPDALRQALATAFKSQKKFQLGRMDDAAECFENILTRIHFHLSNSNTDDDCALGHCISHQKFGMTVIEQVVCECGETSEPLPFVQFVYYVTTELIMDLSQKHKNLSFGHILRLAHSNSKNNCPALCGRQAEVERTLTSSPDIICIGLIWDSDTQKATHIKNFVTAIGTDLKVADLFDSVVDTTWALLSEHKLVGIICYYGKHYSSLLYSKSNIWVSCDDATVTEMGSNWSDVVEKCHRGRYQPSLLLYQNRKATRISTRSAPTSTTMVKSIGPHRHETGADLSSSSKKSHDSDGNANNSSSSRNVSGCKSGSHSKGTTDIGQSSVVTSSKPTTIHPAAIELKGPHYVTNTGHNSGHRDLLGSITLDPRRQHYNACLQGESTYGQSGQPHGGYGVKYYTPPYPVPCQPQYTTVPNHSWYAPNHGGDVASAAATHGLHYQCTADGGPVMTDQRIASVNPVPSGHMVAMPSGASPNLVYNTLPPSQSLSACNLLHDPAARGDVNLVSGASSHHSDLSGFQSNAGMETMENARRGNGQELRVSSQMQASNGFEMLQVNTQGNPSIRTLPSDGSLSDWSLIDGSPGTTYDSTSSLYDNLPDLSVLSIDEKAAGRLTGSSDLHTSSLANSLSMASNNESYYFVPSTTTQFDDIVADYKDRSDEADKLMELSQQKQATGDIYAALICCNQAFSLYSVTRKEAVNLGWSFIEEIEQKVDLAAFRSKHLYQQIQERSRAEKKHKSSAKSPSDQSVAREPIQVARDLMNFEEELKHQFTPQYQALKDCLPHLYSQTLPQRHFRAEK